MKREDYLRLNQDNRLGEGGRIDRARPVTFQFSGRSLMGYAGDTLASALLANGVRIVGRSFKYGRPRGVMTAGVEEPNAIVQLGSTEAMQIPNVRATEQPLYDGLVSAPVNGWPDAENDVMGLFGRLGGRVMGPGFYYKTFMWPPGGWKVWEHVIRRAAGLGRAPKVPDPHRYEHLQHHAELMVVGAGPTGIAAALAAAASGKRVLLIDERSEPGGWLLGCNADEHSIDGVQALQWVARSIETLDANPRVTRLAATTVTGLHDHGFATACERPERVRGACIEEQPAAGAVRHRLHHIRAAEVILATGSHERPLVFANNDLPGCMTAASVSEYIHRYAVVPGRKLLLVTCHDEAYRTALDWLAAGREVVAVVDVRQSPDATLIDRVGEAGIRVITGSVVVEALGRREVSGALVGPVNADVRFLTGGTERIECDVIASSGGFSPVVHLSCHTGSRPVWDEAAIGFVPGPAPEGLLHAAGSVTGPKTLAECVQDGERSGGGGRAGPSDQSGDADVSGLMDDASASSGNERGSPAMPVFALPHARPASRAPKAFVDLQNDVTVADIEMAVREGFESIEHVKRYTAMGFGTDQGKTGNVNGMAVVARALDKPMSEVGTTVFRPNYTPVTMGAVAGAHVGALFDPRRFTPMHAAHLENGAVFEDVGQWVRPRYFPHGEEDMDAAIAREQLATRRACGLMDASTLGKIDVRGPDARAFLDRIYTDNRATLAVGRCRYGVMCGEDGMLMDDGVTACLAEDHFYVTTTTGGAPRVLSWLEEWHQTEWPDLDVFMTSVTEQWATLSVAGPASRTVMQTLCDDIDFSAEAFGPMRWREGTIGGVLARVFSISFTGELSYEINVPAQYGLAVWRAVQRAGEPLGMTAYGTETMHVLRAEKGFVIIGQDSDGSQTPGDLGLNWLLAKEPAFSYLGERGMQRADGRRTDRKQLVGVLTDEPQARLPEGAQAVLDPDQAVPMTMVGHVTSSYHSATLDRSIAMALIAGGRKRMGESVWFPLADGRTLKATIVKPVFVDPPAEADPEAAVASAAVSAGAASAKRGPMTGTAGLSHLEPSLERASASGSEGLLTVLDKGVCGMISLRADPDACNIGAVLQREAGLTLPHRLSSSIADGRTLRWLAPDHWLLGCPLDEVADLASKLETGTEGTVAAIETSGVHVVLELGGDALDGVLRRSTGVDVHPDVFVPGKVVGTLFAKVGVVLRRCEGGNVELIVRRSEADYVWSWLQSASRHATLRYTREG